MIVQPIAQPIISPVATGVGCSDFGSAGPEPTLAEWVVLDVGGTPPNWELQVPFSYTPGQDEQFLLEAPADIGTLTHTAGSRLYYKFSPFGGGDPGGIVQLINSDGRAIFVEGDLAPWYTTPGVLMRVRCWNGLYAYPEISFLSLVYP